MTDSSGQPPVPRTVLSVIGGSGGAGASSFATVLASVSGRATLVDLDPVGGGIDVLLGIEDRSGARWSGIRVDGGYLDPELLADGLPRWQSVRVLAADTSPPADAVEQVVSAAAAAGPVVVDLPRAPSPQRETALALSVMCVLVAVCDVRTLVAAMSVLRSLPAMPVGAVLRRGGLAVAEAIALLDVPLLGVLPRRDLVPSDRGPRVAARIARGIVAGTVAA